MIGGLPGNSFVFVEFEEGGGVFEIAALALGTVGLDFAELVQAFMELVGETMALPDWLRLLIYRGEDGGTKWVTRKVCGVSDRLPL